MTLPRLPGDFLFLDESGDLGLGPRSTSIFVVGILHLRAEHALKRAAKRVRQKELGRSVMAELKWSNSSPKIREAMIEQIVAAGELVAGVSACVVEKGWINAEHARRKSDVRYNYAARLAMEQGGLFAKDRAKRVALTVDHRNVRATESMKEHLDLLRASGELCCDVSLRSGDSQRVPELQAADFAVGAIYAAYSGKDWKHLNALRNGLPVAIRVLREKKPAP